MNFAFRAGAFVWAVIVLLAPGICSASQSDRNRYIDSYQRDLVDIFNNVSHNVGPNSRRLATSIAEKPQDFATFYDLIMYDIYTHPSILSVYESDPSNFESRLSVLMKVLNETNDKMEERKRQRFKDPSWWLIPTGIGGAIGVIGVPIWIAQKKRKEFEFDRHLVKQTALGGVVGSVCGVAIAGLIQWQAMPPSAIPQSPQEIQDVLKSREPQNPPYVPDHLTRWHRDPRVTEILDRP